MINVLHVPVPVDLTLGKTVEAAPAESCRPLSCPACHHPGRDQQGRLVIHVHGCYTRQVQGLAGVRIFFLRVWRFLCRSCKKTISALPHWIHPWRWYAVGTIVEALWRRTIREEKVREIRSRLAPMFVSGGWITLKRWARDFLVRPTLLSWLGLHGADGSTIASRVHRFAFTLCPTGLADLAKWDVKDVQASGRLAVAGSTHCSIDGHPCGGQDHPGHLDGGPRR